MLISLPPSELPAASLPGSLFSREALALAALSPELNAALDVLEAECERSGMTPIYVARPEIFAHGAARDWLKSHSGGARDHIGLSDGATVWRAPGFGNYAFFYGREHLAPMRALETLARRAPELLASLDGQINTALSFVGRGTRHCPAPLALSARASTGDADVTLRRLFVRPHAADGGRASMLACAAVARPTAPFAHLTYAPLTEASLACPDFTALLADRLATAAFDPARLWVLRPPTRIGASLDFGMRLQALLLALARGPRPPPGAPLPTIWVCEGELGPAQRARLAASADLLLHESCEVWRRAPSDYADFGKIAVWTDPARSDASAFAALMTELLGRAPERLAAP